MTKPVRIWLCLMLLLTVAPACGGAQEASDDDAPSSSLVIEGARADREKPGLGHRLLYYIPNRLLDLVDVFRLRARLGPGAAASLRATEYISFYGGTYNSLYAGLPGARAPEKWRSPVGREQLKGLIFFGIDATDDTPYGPRYSPAEFEIGAHLLIVGADVGFEPVEFGDLLVGFLLVDPVGDDL